MNIFDIRVHHEILECITAVCRKRRYSSRRLKSYFPDNSSHRSSSNPPLLNLHHPEYHLLAFSSSGISATLDQWSHLPGCSSPLFLSGRLRTVISISSPAMGWLRSVMNLRIAVSERLVTLLQAGHKKPQATSRTTFLLHQFCCLNSAPFCAALACHFLNV
jgi:hypothetical protein